MKQSWTSPSGDQREVGSSGTLLCTLFLRGQIFRTLHTVTLSFLKGCIHKGAQIFRQK